jgi:glycosyl-4,4'-diaponeurosporenoate acyltransferase
VIGVLASLPFWAALVIDGAIWAGWSVAVGWYAALLPMSAVDRDGWVTRLRPWERQGLAYAKVGIRRWKGRLPDAGRFGGGRRKQLTGRRDPAEWRIMAAETRRAERVHWLILLAFPVEAALHDGVILIPMAAYAVVANLPCIAAQRYNRGRLAALTEQRAARTDRTAPRVEADPGGVSPGQGSGASPQLGTGDPVP